MLNIILATLNNLIRTSVDIGRKTLRNRNASAIGIFTTLIFVIPLWLISLLVFANSYNFIFSREYFGYVVARGALTITTSIGMTFFYKFQTLSEYNTYSLTFGVILGGLVDYYYFHTFFGIRTIIGVMVLFTAGLIISNNKKTIDANKKNTMKLRQVLLSIILLSTIGILETALYKKGVNMQTHPIVHGMFSQLVVFPIVAIIGRKWLKKDIKSKAIGAKDIAIQGALVFVYTIIEPFVVKGLPIVVLRSLSSLRLILFATYDIRKQEFKKRWKILFALFLAISGFILISL